MLLLAIFGTVVSSSAWAGLSAAMSVVGPNPINPGQTTNIVIELTNNSTLNDITAVQFSELLPGTLPNGLKVAAAASNTCGGTLTATLNTNAINLIDGFVPKGANGADGKCIITIPVTGAGTSVGGQATYTYTLNFNDVEGLENGVSVKNVGSSGQGITVNAITQPELTKQFGPNGDADTAVLGGAPVPLTITVSNPSAVDLPNFTVTDIFPTVGGAPAIKVASSTGANSTCTLGGTPATFAPLVDATTITATGGTVKAGGSCTLTVNVEGASTNGLYSTGVLTNTINRSTQFSNDFGLAAQANASDTITVRSPLRVTKAFNKPFLSSGEPDFFTITLYNDGATPLVVNSFADTPIDGVGNSGYGLKATTVTPSCSAGGTAGTYAITGGGTGIEQTGNTTIAGGGSCTIKVDYTGTVQTTGVPRQYTNTIGENTIVTGTAGVVNQLATSSVTVADDLRVTKSAVPTQVVPGGTVKFTVRVENFGTLAIPNVTVTDQLPADLTFLTGAPYNPTVSGSGGGCGALGVTGATGATTPVFTIPTLPGRTDVNTAGYCDVTFWAMASTTATNASALTNTIPAGGVCYNAGAKCNGGGATSNIPSVNTTFVSARKVFHTLGTPVPAGQPGLTKPEGTIVRLSIELTNLSPNALTGVTITDNLPTSGTAQLRIANPANVSSTCGTPAFDAAPGNTSLGINGGTIPARGGNGTGSAGTCLVQVDVVGPAGTFDNTATISGVQTFANGTVANFGSVSSTTARVVYNPSLQIISKTFNPAAVASGGRSTVRVRLNNTGAVALTGVAVTDDQMATGMVVANPANAYSTCAGSPTFTAVPGTGIASMSGASLAGNGTCDFLFDVVTTGAGPWLNTIAAGKLTADGGIRSQSATSGTLNNVSAAPLSVTKATSSPGLTFPGESSVLTIRVTGGSQDVTNLQLTDYFTTDGTAAAELNGWRVTATPNASTTCPGGVVTALPNGTSVGLSGANLASSSNCTVTVNVTSTKVGGVSNIIPPGAIRTDQGLSNPGSATTSLSTQANVGITKQFSPNVVKPGQRSRLKITFQNPTSLALANLGVTDVLPVGVTVPSGANPTTTCVGGTVGSSANGDRVNVSNATLGANASCEAEIDVFVAAQGDYLNTIPASAVTASSGGSPVTNTQPTSDTLLAKLPLEMQKAIDNKTLDGTIQTGSSFTTGTASQPPGFIAPLVISLKNPNNVQLTGVAFTDNLPSGLVLAAPTGAVTTCVGGTVVAAPSGTSVRLASATIAPNSSCTVTVNVLSNIPGVYLNTIPAGAVSTTEGVVNEEKTEAELLVSKPPSVSKQFSPAVVPASGTSRLTIFLINDNAAPITLTAPLVDILPTSPSAMTVATTPNLDATSAGRCLGSVTATSNAATVTYANNAIIPPGGCTITLDVTAGATAGTYNNNIPAGALQTTVGTNQQPANAGVLVSSLGYISGKVFKDNNVVPNGSFDAVTDTPIAGVSIELRRGPNCSGILVVPATTTDAAGNYLFSGLAADVYSVCEPGQPNGTTNGITTAGGIVPVAGSGGTVGTASNPTLTSSQIVNIQLGAAVSGEVSGSTNNNFAEVVPSSISGTVFLDQNNNGVQNGADTGIGGVTVELLNSANAVVATAITDASGNYSFTGLAPGSYAVREPTQPADTSNGKTIAGAVSNGGTPGDATAVTTLPSVIGGTTKIILPPNTASIGNNFAEIVNGRSISGKVFLDFDNTGLFNGSDYGLPTQTLNLTGTDTNGNAVTRTVTTGADGSYSFVNLPESNGTGYTITQPSQPTGTGNGITKFGSTGTAATAPTVPVSVISGINLAGVNAVSGGNDFAEVPGASPDLAISKTHSPANFAAGSSTGYFTIKPSNVGSLPTSGTITMVDTLPTGLTVAETPTGVGWSCVGAVGATTFTCTTTAVIAGGGTGTPITARVAVASGLEGQILTNTAVISGGGEPAGLTGNNTATDPVAVATVAGVRGRVWLDKDHDRIYSAGPTDTPQAAWKVELLLNGVLVASTTSAADGTYAFNSLAPGSGYKIQFRHPTTNLIWGRAVPNEQGTGYTSGTTSGSTDVFGVRSGANPAGADVTDGTLSNLTFTSGTTTIEQSLPLDPSGVVYDAITRQPVAGAVVTITGPSGFVPATHVVGGLDTFTTGADGLYQFLLNPTAPAGVYTLAITTYPGGYAQLPSAVIPACTSTLAVGATPDPALVQSSNLAPAVGVTAHNPAACQGIVAGGAATTQYYFSFNLSSTSANVLNNHIPLDPMSANGFVLSKTGDKRIAEVGDSVRYTIEVRLNSPSVMPQVTVRDRLPAGFTFILGTAVVNGVPAANPAGGLGPVLGFTVGTLRGSTNVGSTAPQVIKIQYRVRVGVGSQQGDGINRARAVGCSNMVGCLDAALLPIANSVQSNEALYKVQVTGGVFTDDACLLGKVFVDCNNNHIQDAEELGIPGVRLHFSDGHFVVTDSEGKYNRCGILPRSHVLSVDPSTLPKGSRLTTSSNRNLGDADSLFLDMKNGELHRGDFIEGSCSNPVLEQVKARRSQGEVRSVETERPAGPALRFESKPLSRPQQGTDSANQPLVQPRTGGSDAR